MGGLWDSEGGLARTREPGCVPREEAGAELRNKWQKGVQGCELLFPDAQGLQDLGSHSVALLPCGDKLHSPSCLWLSQWLPEGQPGVHPPQRWQVPAQGSSPGDACVVSAPVPSRAVRLGDGWSP